MKTVISEQPGQLALVLELGTLPAEFPRLLDPNAGIIKALAAC